MLLTSIWGMDSTWVGVFMLFGCFVAFVACWIYWPSWDKWYRRRQAIKRSRAAQKNLKEFRKHTGMNGHGRASNG